MKSKDLNFNEAMNAFGSEDSFVVNNKFRVQTEWMKRLTEMRRFDHKMSYESAQAFFELPNLVRLLGEQERRMADAKKKPQF